MTFFEWLYLIAGVLFVGLLVYGLRKRPRGDAPTSRRSRNVVERFWDTPEHSRSESGHERPRH